MKPTDRPTPRVVHDGIEELDRVPLGSSLDLQCPGCSAEFVVDPIEIALAGRSIGLCSTRDQRAEATHLSAAFGWPLEHLDEHVYVRGHLGLSPAITQHPCPDCRRPLWVVSSTGELQPGRNATVIEGVVTPPPVKRSEIGWGLLALLLAVGVVVGINVVGARIWFGHRSLIDSGVETQAVVTAATSSELPGQPDQFWLSYRLPTGGTSQGVAIDGVVTRSVDEATWQRASVGDAVTILVDPDDPTRNDVGGNDRPTTMIGIVAIVDLAVVAAGIQIVRSLRTTDAELVTSG